MFFNKGDEPEKPKQSDDLKGAIPKGFEKFYKGASKKEGDNQSAKPSSSSSKDEKTDKGDEKKQKEEGQKTDDEEPTEAPDREKATKKTTGALGEDNPLKNFFFNP